ncbi:ATP-binding protein [Spongiactinospora sp. TRM90649]|uniref:ATP-binding protein n=1 Tax=Spongiactinospora sp. TRM90649 TaxID=3031114 RepID=UPI0023F9314E|nr:ATP-binding protein [Spongiactinospora sp. TRM90649]MDF5754664.1 ATP-binding protein [Spongiactinospora sp. TRM90649]
MVALPCAVRVGRAYTRATLRAWGYADEAFEGDAELVVSELVTNSVHALGFPDNSQKTVEMLSTASLIRISLTELDDTLRVEVWDSDPRLPYTSDRVSFDSVQGRGLEIVAALATSHGWAPSGEDGKVVFALLPLPRSPKPPTHRLPGREPPPAPSLPARRPAAVRPVQESWTTAFSGPPIRPTRLR